MQKTIGLTDFQRDALAVVDEVADAHIPYVLTRENHPRAALVPYEDFLRLQKLDRDDAVLRDFDAMWARMGERTADVDEEEIAADIAAARAELAD